MIRPAQIVRPHNLDEYLLNLIKDIYKNRNISVEVSDIFMFTFNVFDVKLKYVSVIICS